QLKLRMGIHSGPVNPVVDVNDQSNLAGAGINIAQRVMSCGDAGHILLSKRFAEDLEHYARWRSHLHDVGTAEGKHGARIPIFNLYTDQLGNSALPTKLRQARTGFRLKTAAVALLLIAALGVGFWMLRRSRGTFERAVEAIPSKSIAVLPFENLSEEKANAFFADGVQDEILTNLARIADLKVISRMSVMQYKSGIARNMREIAQQLGVANLVEGSVQRSGNRVRVNAQLVDARTDRHVWGQTYDRNLADVFAIQSEIAKAIAEQLQAKLSPREKAAIEQHPTADIAAYDYYVHANALLAVSGDARLGGQLYEAARLLEQAVASDPTFLLAYCKLAYVHQELYYTGFDHSAYRLTQANEAMRKALELGPERGEAHLAAVWVYYHCYFDYDRARSELKIAQSALPNESEVFALAGYMDRRQGHWKEHIQNL